MRVTWTEEAIDSFDEVCDFMAVRSERAAERFSAAAVDAVQQINEFPESGRMVPEHQNPRLREILLYRYRLIYRLSSDGIIIEAFLHASVRLKP